LRSEEAVEYDELSTFLRLNETWDEEIDGRRPAPPVQPVGVPGASSPSQMTNHKPSFAASPSPLRSKNKGQSAQEFDVGTELVGFGLQGVKVTDDELLELVEELGLNDADAGEFVKGLGGGEKNEDGPELPRLDVKSAKDKSERVAGKDFKETSEAKHDVDVEGDAATPAGTEAKSEQEAGKDSKDTDNDNA
jgi:SH3 domain-binding glutamic acid-rich protein